MNFSTFMFSFKDEGVYTFGDYYNQLTSLTIVKVSSSMCNTSANIYPLTEQNLNMLDITP